MDLQNLMDEIEMLKGDRCWRHKLSGDVYLVLATAFHLNPHTSGSGSFYGDFS